MKFGPCEVEVPNDPYRYLETFYGEHYDKMLVLKTPSPNFRKRFPRKYGFLLGEKPQCYYTLGRSFNQVALRKRRSLLHGATQTPCRAKITQEKTRRGAA